MKFAECRLLPRVNSNKLHGPMLCKFRATAIFLFLSYKKPTLVKMLKKSVVRESRQKNYHYFYRDFNVELRHWTVAPVKYSLWFLKLIILFMYRVTHGRSDLFIPQFWEEIIGVWKGWLMKYSHSKFQLKVFLFEKMLSSR